MLRDRDDASLREYLIATAARLIDERGSAGLSVRDIAREAKVADGALYNYFEDKEDLLAQALLAHVATVMGQASQLLPPPGTATVAENLAQFVEQGIAVLVRVIPAFAGLLSQPGVLRRFHDLVGGDAAFEGSPAAAGADAAGADAAGAGASGTAGDAAFAGQAGGRGLPELLTRYLLAEQRLGRIDPGADVTAASTLPVGAIHGQVLPRVLFAAPGTPFTRHPASARGSPRWSWTASRRRPGEPEPPPGATPRALPARPGGETGRAAPVPAGGMAGTGGPAVTGRARGRPGGEVPPGGGRPRPPAAATALAAASRCAAAGMPARSKSVT